MKGSVTELMTYTKIQLMPTTSEDSGKIHESIFRSYHILQKVKSLLALGTAPEVVAELIELMESH